MIDQNGPGKLAGDRKDQENLSISTGDRGTKGTREESGQFCQSKRGQESQGKTGGARRTKKDRNVQEHSVESWDGSGGGGTGQATERREVSEDDTKKQQMRNSNEAPGVDPLGRLHLRATASARFPDLCFYEDAQRKFRNCS